MSDVVESILKSDDLPSPPGVAVKLLELFVVPNVEVDEMVEVISADPALAAKLIDYCNSPLFAMSRETTNIRQAIILMGMKAVKILALSFSLVQTTSKDRDVFDYDQFWSHSLATAASAKKISEKLGRGGEDEFLLGLMLGAGQIGLAHTFPGRYVEMVEESKNDGVILAQLEKKEWGCDRYEITIALLKHWNFPGQLIDPIVEFSTARTGEHTELSVHAQIICLANTFAELIGRERIVENFINDAREMATHWLGFSEETFQECFDQATESWSEHARVLNFDAAECESFEQLERKAIKRIATFSIGLHHENTAIQEQNAELRMTAMFDGLTGLKNRRAYDDDAKREWERTKRQNSCFVLIMVDVDHFKKVNDTYGHAVGDVALVAVARSLQASIRSNDFAYRFGGEEFVVLLTDCSPENALSAVERSRVGIEKLEIQVPEGVLRITASFGVAFHQHPSPGDIEALLETADKLLYQAKNEGRNRICSNYKSVSSKSIPTPQVDFGNPTNGSTVS